MSGNRAQAEDIVSETFARALVARDQIRVGTVKAYLPHDRAQSLSRRPAPRLAARELEPGLPDPAPGPEKAAGDRDALRRVLDALAQLPEADRAALLLSAQEGLTSDEIAATLGLSVAAVKVKIHRARLRLNELRRAWETKP